MALTEDNEPSQQEGEFDFEFPQGVDTDDDQMMEDIDNLSLPTKNSPTQRRNHDGDDYEQEIESQVADDQSIEVGNAPSGMIMPQQHIDECYSQLSDVRDDNLVSHRDLDEHYSEEDDDDGESDMENETQRTIDYDAFPEGFDDDEGDGQMKMLQAAAEAGRCPQRGKKSPRQVDEDDDDGEDGGSSPKSKRPRQSLFGGGPVQAIEVNGELFSSPAEGNTALKTPTTGIRMSLSGINFDEEEHDVQQAQVIEHAFGLISESSSSSRGSPTPSEDSIIIPRDELPAYNLRKNIDRKKGTTYIDQDKTGDYDPAEEAKERSNRLREVRAAAAARKKGGKKNKSAPKRPCEACHGKCIVRLPFPHLMGTVRNITDEISQTPIGYIEIHPECEWEKKHGEMTRKYRLKTPALEKQVPIEDPAGELPDLTGRPIARSCKGCRIADEPCSMVQGGTYPCTRCEDGGHTCELILEFEAKGSCKQCRESDNGECTFITDPDQVDCDNCFDNDLICESLPPLGYKIPRVSLDEHLYGEDRPNLKCTNCRKEKKRCSLKNKTEPPPCKQCKKSGTGCTFEDIPKPPKQKKDKKKKAPRATESIFTTKESIVPEVSVPNSDLFTPEELAAMCESSDEEEDRSREPTPDFELEDSAGNKGLTAKINTPFAHPIKFDSVLGDSPSEVCNFCDIPVFTFTGHYEREVHVIEWYNGLGYTEIGGGHCEHHGPTTMCRDCMLDRAQVLECEEHELVPCVEVDSPPSFEELATDLLDVEDHNSRRLEMLRWCSFCFLPASFMCCKTQPSLSMTGVEEISDEIMVSGCGLRLCARCKVSLEEDFDGNVGDMAAEMELLPKVGEDEANDDLEGRVRADVGFLSPNGLLMKNIVHESEQAEC